MSSTQELICNFLDKFNSPNTKRKYKTVMNNYLHINDIFQYFSDFYTIKQALRIKFINNESYRSHISTISSFLTHHNKDNQLYRDDIQKCHTLLKLARN